MRALDLAILAICLAICGGALGACSEGLNLPLPALPTETPEFPGTAATVFSRVARGSNTCWFGPKGALDRTYIWHGRADPEAKGGTAVLMVHERFEKNYLGRKAFAVTIAPKGEGAAVVVQNLKMADEIGKRMTADAYRWARGGVGCAEGDTSWLPTAPEPAKVAETKKKTPVPRKGSGTGSVAGKAETAGNKPAGATARSRRPRPP